MSDYFASLVRTLVPAAVAWLVVTLGNIGVDVDEPALIAAATSVILGLYYAVVRWLEGRFPWVGWLLGLPKPPSY